MGLILLRKPEPQKASPRQRKLTEQKMCDRAGRSLGAVAGANAKRFTVAITGRAERMRFWILSATRRRSGLSLFIRHGHARGSEAEFLRRAKWRPVRRVLRAMRWARRSRERSSSG